MQPSNSTVTITENHYVRLIFLVYIDYKIIHSIRFYKVMPNGAETLANPYVFRKILFPPKYCHLEPESAFGYRPLVLPIIVFHPHANDTGNYSAVVTLKSSRKYTANVTLDGKKIQLVVFSSSFVTFFILFLVVV